MQWRASTQGTGWLPGKKWKSKEEVILMSKRSVPPQRGFFPQPAYLIGCFREDGTPTFTLTTWVTYAAAEPPTLLFTARNAGQGRLTTAGRRRATT